MIAVVLDVLDRLDGERERLGVQRVEVLEDRDRLGELDLAAAVLEREDGHLLHPVARAVRVPELFAAVADEVHRHVLVRQPLQAEADADPVRRARAEVAVELHVASTF